MAKLKKMTAPTALTPLTEAAKRDLFAKYAKSLPPPRREEKERQLDLLQRVEQFHVLLPGEWNGFTAPNIWNEQELLSWHQTRLESSTSEARLQSRDDPRVK